MSFVSLSGWRQLRRRIMDEVTGFRTANASPLREGGAPIGSPPSLRSILQRFSVRGFLRRPEVALPKPLRQRKATFSSTPSRSSRRSSPYGLQATRARPERATRGRTPRRDADARNAFQPRRIHVLGRIHQIGARPFALGDLAQAVGVGARRRPITSTMSTSA